MNLFRIILFSSLTCFTLQLQGQYWQQEANYNIDVDFNVKKHQFEANQTIEYTNNSPDTLYKAFFHLYYNAFQPGSMMDLRSQTIMDPDPRVAQRIAILQEDEIGYHDIKEIKQDGNVLSFHIEHTIAEVNLASPILPGDKTVFSLKYQSQVPVQIRRTGRDNAEGIDYSMTQWYVKLCEYDYQGWHANPYIGREFHGIWGNFKVDIKIDSDYIIGASGLLTNASDLNFELKGDEVVYNLKKRKTTWSFFAENVIDFAWAADRDYVHIRKKNEAGTVLNYYYQPSERTIENWPALHDKMAAASIFMNQRYGEYPYPQYTFIQGGDGGMEYPMITLITGERTMESLVGVSIHEWMHSWYQMMLATNEALYPWMDEGFTSFGTSETMNYLRKQGFLEGEAQENPIYNTTRRYAEFALSGLEEPLSTHADHYMTNTAYGIGSYVKGAVYLKQLEYIIGKESLDKVLLRYYNEWKFKHPTATDFMRVAEKVSGLELDWYNEYWVNTTKVIDFSIDTIYTQDEKTAVQLGTGLMHMPVDIEVTFTDGSKKMYYIPNTLLRGEKPNEFIDMDRVILDDWPWTHPNYTFFIDNSQEQIESISIDPSGRLADVDLQNNVYPKPEIEMEFEDTEKE